MHSLQNQATSSVYNLDEGHDVVGTRLMMTWTYHAIGRYVPIFIPVSGLGEQELPDDKLIITKIKGLCIGGCRNHLFICSMSYQKQSQA